MKIFKKLEGYKTYIVGSLGITVVALHVIGVVDYETTVTILQALGFGGLLTLRDAISKQGSK